MKGHNLMQAIARVNRVFKDKEGGLIVDYIGIGRALKEAMSDYTKADQDTLDNANIRDSAYPKFQEKLEVCRNVFSIILTIHLSSLTTFQMLIEQV